VYYPKICLTEKGKPEFMGLVDAYLPARQGSFNRLLDLKDKLGFEGLDLMWQLLNVDPQKRISAEAALSHPFFDEIKKAPVPP